MRTMLLECLPTPSFSLLNVAVNLAAPWGSWVLLPSGNPSEDTAQQTNIGIEHLGKDLRRTKSVGFSSWVCLKIVKISCPQNWWLISWFSFSQWTWSFLGVPVYHVHHCSDTSPYHVVSHMYLMICPFIFQENHRFGGLNLQQLLSWKVWFLYPINRSLLESLDPIKNDHQGSIFKEKNWITQFYCSFPYQPQYHLVI